MTGHKDKSKKLPSSTGTETKGFSNYPFHYFLLVVSFIPISNFNFPTSSSIFFFHLSLGLPILFLSPNVLRIIHSSIHLIRWAFVTPVILVSLYSSLSFRFIDVSQTLSTFLVSFSLRLPEGLFLIVTTGNKKFSLSPTPVALCNCMYRRKVQNR